MMPIVLKTNLVKLQSFEDESATGCSVSAARHFQNLFEIVERRLRLAVHVDNITQFLQRAENEKRIDEERKNWPTVIRCV